MIIKQSAFVTQQLKLTLVWVVLILSTIGSWVESVSVSVIVTMLIISLALLKVVLVISYYMEVGRSARWLKLLCGTWVIMVFTGISICYLSPNWIIHLLNGV